jgi:hypothetical protein
MKEVVNYEKYSFYNTPFNTSTYLVVTYCLQTIIWSKVYVYTELVLNKF